MKLKITLVVEIEGKVDPDEYLQWMRERIQEELDYDTEDLTSATVEEIKD